MHATDVTTQAAAVAPPSRAHRAIAIGLWALLGLTMAGVAVYMVLTRVKEPDLPVLLPPTKWSLTDQDGRPVSSDDLHGRVWAAGFIFTTCPGICPQMSARMAKLQEQLPKDVHMVSFTVDPATDTPAVLKAYAQRHKADPSRWHFLTGEKAKVVEMIQQMKVPFTEATGDQPIIHSEKLLLIDADGNVRGLYPSNEPEAMDKLVDDATALAKWTAKNAERSGKQ